MISIDKRFLFIHIPKTAGNSIQNILINYSDDFKTTSMDYQDGIERFEIKNYKHNFNKHSSITEYKNKLDTELYDSLFKFSVIRNPWDRMISYYFSPHRGISEWDRDQFIEMVDSVPSLRDYVIVQSMFERLLNKIGIRVNSKDLISDIDYLIRYEKLNDDFRIVCEKLNIEYIPLPKRNSSKRKHYSYYYDGELIKLVKDKFYEEVLLGDYQFQNS